MLVGGNWSQSMCVCVGRAGVTIFGFLAWLFVRELLQAAALAAAVAAAAGYRVVTFCFFN